MGRAQDAASANARATTGRFFPLERALGVRQPAPAVLGVARGRGEPGLEPRPVAVEALHGELARVLREARREHHRQRARLRALGEGDLHAPRAAAPLGQAVARELARLVDELDRGLRKVDRQDRAVVHAATVPVDPQLHAFPRVVLPDPTEQEPRLQPVRARLVVGLRERAVELRLGHDPHAEVEQLHLGASERAVQALDAQLQHPSVLVARQRRGERAVPRVQLDRRGLDGELDGILEQVAPGAGSRASPERPQGEESERRGLEAPMAARRPLEHDLGVRNHEGLAVGLGIVADRRREGAPELVGAAGRAEHAVAEGHRPEQGAEPGLVDSGVDPQLRHGALKRHAACRGACAGGRAAPARRCR